MSSSKYSACVAEVYHKLRPPPVVYRGLVKKVIVVLTASRSGSSYFTRLLQQHPKIATLPGEEEPFYILSGNGFAFGAASDAFKELVSPETLAGLIWQDMVVNEPGDQSTYLEAWRRRLLLQFQRDVPLEWLETIVRKRENWLADMPEAILGELVSPLEAGWYDVSKRKMPFVQQVKIEEPPFVCPLHRRPIVVEDLEDHVLLFKTPQDAYRIGTFEQLYPQAEIKYIHLTRGFAQTVNGLIDGWLCDYGFFSHNLLLTDEDSKWRLNIRGYSNATPFGRDWWKFDLPPNWREFRDAELPDVCLNQWVAAHGTILESDKPRHQVQFEDLCGAAREEILDGVWEYVGLKPLETVDWNSKVMITEEPEPKRWWGRRGLLEPMAGNKRVKEIMSELGYSLDSGTWH